MENINRNLVALIKEKVSGLQEDTPAEKYFYRFLKDFKAFSISMNVFYI